MKRVLIKTFAILATAVILTGCSKSDTSKENDATDKIKMTAIEKELLSDAFGRDITDKNIHENEKEELMKLREAMGYLNAKYPEHKPDILSYVAGNSLAGPSTLYLRGENGNDYEVNIVVEGKAYSISDNYYGVVIGKDFDRYLEETINIETMLLGIKYRVVCRSLFSELRNEKKPPTLEWMLSAYPPVNKTIRLYVIDETDQEKATEDLQKIMLDNGIYGAFTVFFTNGAGGDDIEMLETNRLNYERTTFNTF